MNSEAHMLPASAVCSADVSNKNVAFFRGYGYVGLKVRGLRRYSKGLVIEEERTTDMENFVTASVFAFRISFYLPPIKAKNLKKTHKNKSTRLIKVDIPSLFCYGHGTDQSYMGDRKANRLFSEAGWKRKWLFVYFCKMARRMDATWGETAGRIFKYFWATSPSDLLPTSNSGFVLPSFNNRLLESHRKNSKHINVVALVVGNRLDTSRYNVFFFWNRRLVQRKPRLHISGDVPSSRHPKGAVRTHRSSRENFTTQTSPHKGLSAKDLSEHRRLTQHLHTPCGLSNPIHHACPDSNPGPPIGRPESSPPGCAIICWY
ncbi:hypothetical protein LXL04_014530 [Taraxacum kok-saghyz]